VSYKLPAWRSDTARYMRVAPIDLFVWWRSVRRDTALSEAGAYVKMTSRRAEKCQDLENISRTKMVITRGGNEELIISQIRSLPRKKGFGSEHTPFITSWKSFSQPP
jgi:hypothetical protein